MATEVRMKAYDDLVDPIAGQVKGGEEFTTNEQNAKAYRRANWAGAPGENASDVQARVAAQEFEDHEKARVQMREGRQAYRNLSPSSVERENVGADSPIGGNVAMAVARLAQGASATEGEQSGEGQRQSGDEGQHQSQQEPQPHEGTPGESQEDQEDQESQETQGTAKPLSRMNRAELEQRAAENGVEYEGKNADTLRREIGEAESGSEQQQQTSGAH